MSFYETPAGKLFDIIGRYRSDWGVSVTHLVLGSPDPQELVKNLSMLDGFVEYSPPSVLVDLKRFMDEEPIFSTQADARTKKSALLRHMTQPGRENVQVRQSPQAAILLKHG